VTSYDRVRELEVAKRR